MKFRRNNNEEMWQLRRNFVTIETKSYAKPITYDAAAECATKSCRNLRRKSMVISTSAISQNQIYDAHVVYATKIRGKLRRSCVDIATMTLGFKKKNYMKYGITILHCNMVYHIVCHITIHNPWVCWNTLFSFPNDKKFFADEGAQLYWSIWGSVLKLDHNFGDFLKCIIKSIGNFI
jgi:hypothetical protein